MKNNPNYSTKLYLECIYILFWDCVTIKLLSLDCHCDTFAAKDVNQPSPVSLPGGYLLLLNLHHLVLLFKGNIIVTLHSKYVVQFVAMAYTLNLASQ